MKAVRWVVVGLVFATLLACVQTTVRKVDRTPPKQSSQAIAEDDLLDVGIVVFESNIPQAYDDIITANITPEIRRAEANYVVNYAKELLQSTGNWGAVRVIPAESHAVDVVVTGGIVHSDGERQVLAIRVKDARGVVWFERQYENKASKYAYEPSVPRTIDPFQTNYRHLADDMLEYVESLSSDEITEIRATAEMRFARDFSPDAFDTYITENRDGEFQVVRLPSEDDANMRRVRKVREREFLFIDTLDEYYDRFASNMYEPYQNWRQGTYDDAINLREERDRARARLIAGTVMILGGAVAQRSSNSVTEYAGYAGVIGGATEVVGSIQNRANVQLYASALQELGTSAAKEIVPHTIELENATISLQGTVDKQYEQLRAIIKRLYYEDLGILAPESEEEVAESQDGRPVESVTEEFFQESE